MSGVAKRKLEVIQGGGQPDGGDTQSDDWRGKLIRNRDQRIESTLHNLCLILEHDPALAGVFWLNESSNQVVMSRQPPWASAQQHEFTDLDAAELAAWLQHPDRYAIGGGADLTLQAVVTVARRHRRHPIREYLNGLVWDGVPRVERMLVDLFGCDDKPYIHRVSLCYMVGAVARVLWEDPKQPQVGAKVDFMLVLEGPQGKKKSTAIQDLFGGVWYVETHESPSSKDFYQIIQGVWCVEIAEMDSFNKADVTSVKAAITRRTDKFRAPYERMPRSYRRECVFAGTTNENQYLRDPTGGRRFLPVRVREDRGIDLPGIRAARDQLWAEAVALFVSGTQWWELPDDADAEQEERYAGDSWEDRVGRWLAMKAPGDNAYPPRLTYVTSVDYVTTDELLLFAIGIDAARHDRPAQMRVAAAMKRLGWRQSRVMTDSGYRERRWVPNEGPPSASEERADDVPF